MRACKVLCVPALALLAATGCHVSFHGFEGTTASLWGQDVVVRSSSLEVDGVALEHDRWEEVDLAVDGLERLTFGTASEAIALTGDDGATARLRVHVYSELPGDGTVAFEDGKLVARGDRGKAFVNAVEGTIPRGVAVGTVTGIGEIRLHDVARGAALRIDTGTGDVELRDVAPAELELESGTGDLVAHGGGAAALKAASGTGDIRLTGGTWGRLSFDMGTGDVVLEDCETTAVTIDSGTGDLVIDGGRCGRAEMDSGTGDLVMRGGADVASHEVR